MRQLGIEGNEAEGSREVGGLRKDCQSVGQPFFLLRAVGREGGEGSCEQLTAC